ncbi:MAG TPA: SCO family protein [Pseudogracilibacillus sp.]|nr:SCO family protein [Pseudogracilibacillus sp.]
MSKFIKIVLLITLSTFILAACSNDDVDSEIKDKMKNEDKIESNMDETVTDFEFINQDEETVSLDDLKGEYWIADLVFTNCTTVCIPMTSNMKVLQDEMIEEDLTNIELISFSVDPDYDTPEVFRDYAEEYDVSLDNWSFLTGYEFDEIKEISIKTFRSMLQEPQPGDDQITHGTRFFLINPEGVVIKSYDGVNGRVAEEIIEDLKKL